MNIVNGNTNFDIVDIMCSILDRHKVTYGQQTEIKHIELGWLYYDDVINSQFTDRTLQFWKDGRICYLHGNSLVPLHVVGKEKHFILCWKEQFEGQKENPTPFPVVCGHGFEDVIKQLGGANDE